MASAPMRVTHYAALIEAIRARVAELDVSHELIDHIAGLPGGYTSKLLCNPPMKHFGVFTMFLLLHALGLELAIAPSLEAMERVRSRLKHRPPRFKRNMLNGSRHRGVTAYFGRDLLRIRGAKGGFARGRNLSKRKLSQIGRMGAKARWQRADGENPST